MTSASLPHIDFAETIGKLESEEVVQYSRAVEGEINDVAQRTLLALEAPEGFPPMSAAIVPGDHVALAIDPNTPEVLQVLGGVLKALSKLDLGGIEIILWDEATDYTVANIQREVGEAINVVRHQSSRRSDLRYLGADQSADPIYLNRQIVDSDFVLPIAVGRPLNERHANDLTGVFPAFADSRSRMRQNQRWASGEQADAEADLQQVSEPSWLLGLQLMLCIVPNAGGGIADVFAATPDAVRNRLTPAEGHVNELPPDAPLVIASLDGDAQQQTWTNAARAIAAASRFVSPGGTIVLWSAIQDVPGTAMQNLTDADAESLAVELLSESQIGEEEDFPDWDVSDADALVLRRIASEHRVMIHSHLENETVEATGLAAIENEQDLIRLSRSFKMCGVLQAAQFASEI